MYKVGEYDERQREGSESYRECCRSEPARSPICTCCHQRLACAAGQKVNGIVPGYSGHVPGAKIKFGEPHVGSISRLLERPRAQGGYTQSLPTDRSSTEGEGIPHYKPMSADHTSTQIGYKGHQKGGLDFQKSYRKSVNGIVVGCA